MEAEHQRIDVFNFWCSRRLQSPLDSKIKLVNSKGNQLHWKNWRWSWNSGTLAFEQLTYWKRPWCSKGQKEKGVTENEMTEWHHQLNGHEFEQSLGESEGPRSLACFSPWSHKEMTGLSNWTTTATRAIWYFLKGIWWVKVFPDSSVDKESACNAGDPSSIVRSGRSTGEGIGYPLQYSWAFLVVQIVKNLTAMRKEKATHFSILAWRIPCTV